MFHHHVSIVSSKPTNRFLLKPFALPKPSALPSEPQLLPTSMPSPCLQRLESQRQQLQVEVSGQFSEYLLRKVREGGNNGPCKNILMVPTISDVSTAEEWRVVAEEIVRKNGGIDLSATIVDRPGLGYSDRPKLDYDADVMERFLVDFMSSPDCPIASSVAVNDYVVFGGGHAATIAVLATRNDPENVTPGIIESRHELTKRKGARYVPAAFLTGLLDPVNSREEFIELFAGIEGKLPVLVMSTSRAPKRSKAKMEALRGAKGVSKFVANLWKCLVLSFLKKSILQLLQKSYTGF